MTMDLMIDPPCVHAVRDGDEVLGYVAIDSTVCGRSLGGLRMAPDVSKEEVAALARAMTLKYGLAGLPQGGAKAGLLGDPEAPAPARRQRLAAFARAMAPLLRSRRYQPDTDMGTRASDIHEMMAAVGMRLTRQALRTDRSGYYTALTVLAGARAALARQGARLQGATVAIEGFGAVGSALARLLQREGARVVAISTSRGALHRGAGLDVLRLATLATGRGSDAVRSAEAGERIGLAELLELPVDVLFPCARPFSIRVDNAARIRARVVAPGANAPATPNAERALFERGVMVVPDFVANCGGVIGGTMAFASVPEARIEVLLLERVGAWIENLLDRAERMGVPLREVATPIALARFEEVRRQAESPGVGRRLLEAGLGLYRHGLLPRRIVGAMAPGWFERSLAPFPPDGAPS